MNRLMAVNPELSSRFSEEIIFRDMTSDHCLQLLDRHLKEKEISVAALQENLSASYRKWLVCLRSFPAYHFGETLETCRL